MAKDVVVHVVVDSRAAERGFERSSRAARGFGRDVDRTFRGVLAGSGALRQFSRSLAFASTAFIGTASITAGLRASVGAASDLAEQTNKVNVIFGEGGREIINWGRNTARSIGIADDQALEAAGTFGNLFQTVGLGAQENARLSRSLVELAADLASFNNASPEETLDAIRSGLIGEAEPLRRFGVLLSEARVQQEAMRTTGKRTAKELTDQDKLLARYALILKDTSAAQGDFARTQDGLANASRQLKAEIRDTEASIGRALLPTVRRLTIGLRDWLGDARNQRRLQRDVNEAVRDGAEVVRGLVRVMQGLRAVLRPIVGLLGGVENAATIAGLAFVGLRLRAVAAGLGIIGSATAAEGAATKVGLLGKALRTLPGRIGISILIAAELVGPGKKLFEQLFGADFRGITPGGGVDLFGQRGQRRANARARALRRAGNNNDAIRAALLRENFSEQEVENALNQITPTGEDVRLRGAARGSFQQTGRTGTRKTRASLRFQLSLLDEELAKAELTAGQKDDRSILTRKAALTRQLIGKTRDLKERTALYQQLGSIESQIKQIDEQSARTAEDARKEQVDARRRQLGALRDRQQTLKAQIADIKDQFKAAVDTARDAIGSLFQGPVLNPSESATKGILGVRGPNARTLTADLNAQVAEARRRQREIAAVVRRAPAGIRAQLRKELAGVDISQLDALAAPGANLQPFFRAFTGRERFARQTARAEMKAQLVRLHADRVVLAGLREREQKIVVELHADGKKLEEVTATHRARRQRSTPVQRRGPNAGQAHG